jgi:hypothetical protein
VGKAGTPFGGERVISLFAHKKYDMLIENRDEPLDEPLLRATQAMAARE